MKYKRSIQEISTGVILLAPSKPSCGRRIMDREAVIRMAREAGIGPVYGYESIEYFAYLVAEHEREAIWNLLFEYAGRDDLSDSDQSLLKHLSDLIAARWQEWSNKKGEESWIEKK